MAESQSNAPLRAAAGAPTSGVIHVRTRLTTDFTVIPNALAQRRGSAVTIGVATYILSVPDGSSVSIGSLRKHFLEGEILISRALNELEAAGYLERRSVRGANGEIRTRTFFYDVPGGYPDADVDPDSDPDPDGPPPKPPKPRRLRQPRKRPGIAAAAPPVAGPVLVPTPDDVPAPAFGAVPVSAPVSASVSAPVSASGAAPVSASGAVPVSAPVSAPGSALVSAPEAMGGPDPTPARTEAEPEPQPAPVPEANAAPPAQLRDADPAAIAVLAALRRVDPRLVLSEQEAVRLAPAVSQWLAAGVGAVQIIDLLTERLPYPLRARPAGILAFRLRQTPLPAPPRLPLPEATGRPAVLSLQNCDGCDRAFRAPEPGLCRGCRNRGALRAAG